ncbi:MAG TPA: methyltransferase domain-containing protein [Thermoleophilaceae bacterium]
MQAPGTLGLSEELRRFVEEAPYERRTIVEFVGRAAGSLLSGARVLDVGAGDAPYRELFEHVDYVTTDWSESPHEQAREADVIASAERLPVEDQSFDALLFTQVLEHVADPRAVLGEAHRVLRAGGRLFVTVPLVWELHELPYDYWRYTPASLETLAAGAGFTDVDVQARNDCFTTLAQLMLNARHVMGRAPDGLDSRRDEAAALLEELAARVAELAPLDVEGILPLGFSMTARRV